ncbi:MAG: AMP-binding protein [Mycobacteriales bacterium]
MEQAETVGVPRPPGPASPGPAPGAAPLIAASPAALLRRNGTDPGYADRPAVLFDDLAWSHAQFLSQCRRWAGLLSAHRPADPAAPFHVGVLLDNTPDYLAVLGAAALLGAAVAGLNPTRQGEQLARDANHVDLAVLVTEPVHAPLVEAIRTDLRVGRILTTRRFAAAGGPVVGEDAGPLLAAGREWPDHGPAADPDLDRTWALVFTSGTTSAPKAVICSGRRLLVTGERLRQTLQVGPEDVGYLAMPLFHSNSLMVGLLPALVAGASVALTRRFSASRWLADIRRYGVTYWNYTGKPLAYLLATPERSDDADNPLRRAYGNEGSDRIVAAFARRFGVSVIDAFGPTEGGVGVTRADGDPPGALGRAGENVQVVDDDGVPRPPARFDAQGRLSNVDECVGEIVNTAGPGPFEGYYANPEATARATRGGWYWSGDLGYVDENGFVFFAGRTTDWLRVDGENFPTGPIEAALADHPDVLAAAVYGVPDPQAGDAVMCALVLRPGAELDPAGFARWLDARPELGPKWRPRWLRLAAELPRTPTHKVLHRELARAKWRRDLVGPDSIWWRPRGAAAFVEFTPADEDRLRAEFAGTGRDRFWEL